MIIAYEKVIEVMLRECNLRKNFIFILFCIISLSFLSVGYYWPKIYTSYADIHIDNTNILQPLMRGAAETTQAVDHVQNAKEILFGDKIMDQIISEAEWYSNAKTDIEQARIKKVIKENVHLKQKGDSLLTITYANSNPEHAYFITKRLAELFVEMGEKSKVEESQSAYNFINQQALEYLEKLTRVEEALREYRSENPDARPGLENEVSASITRLQRSLEQANMELREADIKKQSIIEQLSGEAAIVISQSKEGQYKAKITSLQERLEGLRLDYKETYPDIQRIKSQIKELESALNQEISNRTLSIKKSQQLGELYIDDSIAVNPLYQELRSSLSTTETEMQTLNARINGLKNNLSKEYERAKRIFGGEAKLTKLTRDYEVNQQIYQDLLRRLENARVSKSLDEQQEVLTFKIQEAAKIPVLPTGARFLHFVIMGLLLGVVVPVSLIYALIQFDPRVRYSTIISSDLDLPVLAELTRHISPNDVKENNKNLIIIVVGVLVVLTVYSYVGWLKFMENI